ncbi:MAG TPA: MFS transporter [Candidatus Dormibacteraeota bacterium]|nr:MFS transporter [Candidatus Dormibacteraeota bacterium]
MLSKAQQSPEREVHERLLLLVLAAIQFTAVVDFLIILPLGPQYMRVFAINPGQFGLIVSSYAISAGISGVTTGIFLDRFDRKRALLWLYLGFAIGTLFCALAPTYPLLVLARALAGAFGGVAGAFILAIVGDVVPEARRGAAMGLVMSSFSVASIVGVPLGLVLASSINWHVPFFVLAGLSLLILAVAARVLPSLRGHLEKAHDTHPVARFLAILKQKDHQMAFLFMALLTFTGFVVFPNVANYMVLNVGLTEHQLPLIYLAGGACTVFSMNWIGRWSDRAGKLRVFAIMSCCAIVPILLVTNLPRSPLAVAVATSTLLMICMSGRMVPAMALMTASVEARYRGGFMSVNSSVQQLACGVAAFVSGHLLSQASDGRILHFPVIGILSMICAALCIPLSRYLRVPERQSGVINALPAEG